MNPSLDDVDTGVFDLDLWLYDIGFGCQMDGDVLPFEVAKDRVDARVEEIMSTLGLEHFEGYFTGSNNFRYDIAFTQEYKAGRVAEKPFHFYNIRNYLIFKYGAVLLDKIEADDMCAYRMKQLGHRGICISRDKDLRMFEGWHYGYECGKQGEFGPLYVDRIGTIEKNGVGYGMKFFWAQMIMGDPTDHIAGCKGKGKVAAFDVIDPLTSEEEMAIEVAKIYQTTYGDNWKAVMREQGILLWMHDNLNEDGTPVLWELPDCVKELSYGQTN